MNITLEQLKELSDKFHFEKCESIRIEKEKKYAAAQLKVNQITDILESRLTSRAESGERSYIVYNCENPRFINMRYDDGRDFIEREYEKYTGNPKTCNDLRSTVVLCEVGEILYRYLVDKNFNPKLVPFRVKEVESITYDYYISIIIEW